MTWQMMMDYLTLIEEYCLDQRIRGNTPATLIYYRHALGLFADFAGGQPLTLNLLKRYYLYLSDKGISSVTVQSYIRAVRAFLVWLWQNEYVPDNLALKFRLPKATRKVIDVLTDDEIRQLYASFDESTFLGLRNLVIVSLMLDSGCRLEEVAGILWRQVHLEDRYLIVLGKGQKQRVVPFGEQTAAYLTAYLARLPESRPEKLLVKWSGGEAPEGLTGQTIKLMFRKLRNRCGIPRLHPHLLRHTFATKYLENGGNIYTLQAILGHTSLEMVKRYLHLATVRIRADFPRFSPLDQVQNAKKGGQ